MPFLVKILRTGLGLTSEAIHAARDRPSSNQPSSDAYTTNASDTAENVGQATVEAPAQTEQLVDGNIGHQRSNPPQSARDPPDYLEDHDQDEAIWQLDDMAESVRPRTQTHETMAATMAEDTPVVLTPEQQEADEEKIKQREALTRELVAMAGSVPDSAQRLSCPVIVPQRRPRNKDRGFVRVYAPVLDDCGISQDVFLRFLEYLDAVNHASAWIDVIFVAAQIAGSIPSPAAMIVGTIIAIVAGAARELQKRTRANTFLEMVNRDLFIPRGLFAVVMAFKPEIPSSQQGPFGNVAGSVKKTLFKKEKLDINQTVEKWSNTDPSKSKFKKCLDNIRLQSGETNSELELPEAASLIYPDLDQIAVQASQDEGVMNKFKGAGNWVNDYMDRRAAVFYEAKHPGTPLVLPAEQRKPMKSRFNDPNHPANSGSIISLVTGGHAPVPGLNKLHEKRNEALGINRVLRRPADTSRDGRLVSGTGRQFVKKKLQKDVLYLMIVNLPTEEEEKEARELDARLGDMMEPSEAGVP